MSKASSQSGGVTAGGGSAHQANEITRNMILGIGAGGLTPESPEAGDLQAAEAFVSDIQQEILAYDTANAMAMEAAARTWWSRVPILGRWARKALQEEREWEEYLEAQRQSASSSSALHGGLAGLDAAAVAAAGNVPFLHSQSSKTAGGFTVERTSAVDASQLHNTSRHRAAEPVVYKGKVIYPPNRQGAANSWLFKRSHPNWVPLMQRWWVPWVCAIAVVGVWVPDVWKLRVLYYCDHRYALFRQAIHKAYWQATMSTEDYEALMADIEAQRPTVVKSTDCPF